MMLLKLAVIFIVLTKCQSQQTGITRQLSITTSLPFTYSTDNIVDSTTTLYSTINTAFCSVLQNAFMGTPSISSLYTVNCQITQFVGTNPISYNSTGMPSYVSLNAMLTFNGNWTQAAAVSGINTTLSPSSLTTAFTTAVSNASWMSAQTSFVQPIVSAFNVPAGNASTWFNLSTLGLTYFPECSSLYYYNCAQFAICTETNNNYACQCNQAMYFIDSNPSVPGTVCTEPCSQSSCQNGGSCVQNNGSTITCLCPPNFYGPMCSVTLAWLFQIDDYLMNLVIAFAVVGGVLLILMIILMLVRRNEKKRIERARREAEDKAQMSQHKEVVNDLLIPLSKKKRSHHRRQHGSTVGLLHLLKKSRSKQSLAAGVDRSSQIEVNAGSSSTLSRAPSTEEMRARETRERERERDHGHGKHSKPLRKTQSHPAFLEVAGSTGQNQLDTPSAEGGPIMIKPKFDVDMSTPGAAQKPLHPIGSHSHLFVPHREQAASPAVRDGRKESELGQHNEPKSRASVGGFGSPLSFTAPTESVGVSNELVDEHVSAKIDAEVPTAEMSTSF